MKYRVTLNNKVYEVEVEEGTAMLVDEYEAKSPVSLSGAGTAAYSVSAENGNASSSGSAAASAPNASQQSAIKDGYKITAPIPGSVTKIFVKEGESVKAGQLLLIIEALKMENEILAHDDGIIKQLAVNTGSSVATGDVLIVM